MLRPAPRSASIGSVRVANHAGAAPKDDAGDEREAERERQDHRRRTRVDRQEGRPGERERQQQARGADGDDEVRRAPPATARRMLSTSACVTICRRDAPIASRTAVWPRRATARREQQVRDVGAGDEQHQPAHAEENLRGCVRSCSFMMPTPAPAGTTVMTCLGQGLDDRRASSSPGSPSRAASTGGGCR